MITDDLDIKTYFRDIGREETLDAQANLDLAYVARGKPHKSSEPRYRLLDTNEAEERMIVGNLALVVSIAKQYLEHGLSLDDLIAEGNLGLHNAVEKYDPFKVCERTGKTCKFSTYATVAIERAIERCLMEQVGLVRIPNYVLGVLPKWKRAYSQLKEEYGCAPTPEEVVDKINENIDKENKTRNKRKVHVKKEHIPSFLAGVRATNKNEGSVYLGSLEFPEDIVPNGLESKTPLETVSIDDAIAYLTKNIDRRLSKRDARILRLRYGLGGREPQTLKQVSEKIKLSKERVRQIEENSIKLLGEMFGLETENQAEEMPQRRLAIGIVARFYPVVEQETRVIEKRIA